MVRPEYWDKSKELLKYCNEDELKVLSQQATRALNGRIDKYLGKLEAKDLAKSRAAKKAIKGRLSKPC